MKTTTKNILFRLLTITSLLAILAVLILFLIKLFGLNSDNVFLINIIGLIGVAIFLLIETAMLLVNIKKQIIFHALIFNEHNSTINWPAFIVANIGLGIGLTLSITGLVLYFTSNNLDIVTSAMVIVPIGLFLLFNCVMYDVYVLLFKQRKLKPEDLIK